MRVPVLVGVAGRAWEGGRGHHLPARRRSTAAALHSAARPTQNGRRIAAVPWCLWTTRLKHDAPAMRTHTARSLPRGGQLAFEDTSPMTAGIHRRAPLASATHHLHSCSAHRENSDGLQLLRSRGQ